MDLKIRRVVTGHDPATGDAVVAIDETCTDLRSRREGVQSTVIWSTAGFPVDNDDPADGAARELGTTHENGTVFRVVRYAPGVVPRRHRTDSVDYAVVIEGCIDMELDGQTVTLRAGDVLVQRGTIHNWVNHGPGTCTIAFVLVSAHPARPGGRPLEAVG